MDHLILRPKVDMLNLMILVSMLARIWINSYFGCIKKHYF